MRVVDLSERDLNILVARVLELEQIPERSGGGPEFYYWTDKDGYHVSGQFSPSSDWEHAGWVIEQEGIDRKSTRLNSSHSDRSRMPSSA